jgi:hypothetical protein
MTGKRDGFIAEIRETWLRLWGELTTHTRETTPPARIASMKAFLSTLSEWTGGYQYHAQHP